MLFFCSNPVQGVFFVKGIISGICELEHLFALVASSSRPCRGLLCLLVPDQDHPPNVLRLYRLIRGECKKNFQRDLI